MSKRPDTYQDWRKLYWSLCRELGMIVYHRTVKGRPPIDRDSWMLIHRIKRVLLRLDAESEAFTSSYCDALVQLVRRHKL